MNISIYLALAFTLCIYACSNPSKNTLEASNAKTQTTDSLTATTTYKVDTIKSKIAWEGAEGLLSIVKTHNGLLSINNGNFQVQNDSLVGGSFTIPLKTLTVLDIHKEKPGNAKLVKHLLAADFFYAEKFKDAFFNITNVKSIAQDSILITGNLTLKGVAKSITFKSKILITNGNLQASTQKFYFNRKDWGMNYGTERSLGDELIRPEIGITLNLFANKN